MNRKAARTCALETVPWWLWPNLWGIDAAAVAVVWQRFLGHCFHAPVPITASIALGCVVWGIYLADRWLDTRTASPDDWRDRHRFAARHPKLFAILAFLVLVASFGTALTLSENYLIIGGILAGVVSVYMTIVHLMPKRPIFALKESTVGLLFGAGVAIPLLAAVENDWRQWLAAVVGFAFLCILNCLLISKWESPPGKRKSSVELLICACMIFLSGSMSPNPIAISLFASLSGLVLLNWMRSHFGGRALRVLADAVLLSPLLVMWWL